jgi:hypothetical protein
VDAFGEWKTGFKPVFEAILATLNHYDSTCERKWAPALLADADQLLAASSTVKAWSWEHPCPNANVDGVLARLARTYAYAASSLEDVSKGSSVTWLVPDHERRGLHAGVAKVLTMLYKESQHPGRRQSA